jgi:hypothetical protein
VDPHLIVATAFSQEMSKVKTSTQPDFLDTGFPSEIIHMKTTTKPQWWLGAMLALLMAATRSHHFATPTALPDASWAVFFLAGAWLASPRWLVVLLGLAAGIDAFAVGVAGVSGYCVTPAYAALLPSYALLWAAGRAVCARPASLPRDLARWSLAVIASAMVAELGTSGAFYFFGGHFAAPTLVAFLQREFVFFPPMLGAMAFYVALARSMQMLAALLHPQAMLLHD